MNDRMRQLVVVLAASALLGCIPEKRIVWSSDGRRAAVIGADGLHVCDGEGVLSPLLVKDARHAAWFPDSQRLLVARTEQITTWDALTEHLAAARRERLIAVAKRMHTEALAYEGDLDDFEPTAEASLTSRELVAAILYLRDHQSEGLSEKFGEKWDALRDASVDLWSLQVWSFATGGASAGPVVMRSFDHKYDELRLAPDGSKIAFVGPATDDDDTPVLYVAPIAPDAEARVVAKAVAMYPDWTPDSRSLVYIRAARGDGGGKDTLELGALTQREVCDAGGRMPEEFKPERDLAGLVFDALQRVRCLGDGRILFASLEVHLPSTAEDMPRHVSLFSLDLNRRATVARVLTREAESQVGDALALFEVSPDETRVAMSDTNGGVSVLTLRTGQVEAVVPSEDDKLRTIPVWRSIEELCVAVPIGSEHGSPERAEIALWSKGKLRTISRAWPKAVVEGFLTPEEKQDGQAPAISPG
ncbi:MAG: hypothetical protein V3T70_11170 [Phycisphaerae bacterium]